MPRARLAVGGYAGETTATINSRHWNANRTYLQLLSVQRCQHAAPPTGRALLLGGGSAMALDVQGGYRAVCGRSICAILYLSVPSRGSCDPAEWTAPPDAQQVAR